MRRSPGGPHAVPEGNPHSRRASFVACRNVRCGEPALLRHHCVGLYCAAPNMGQHARGFTAHDIDLTAQHVLNGRRISPIRHEFETGLCLVLKIDRAQMRCAADSYGSSRCAIGMIPEPGDRSLEVLRRHFRASDHHQWHACKARHRLEIRLDIELHRVENRTSNMARPVADNEPCPSIIGGDPRHPVETDGPTGTRDILNNNARAQRQIHMLG